MLNYKVKLELEWDGNFDEEDWIKYNPDHSIEDGKETQEDWIKEDQIYRLLWHADNTISNYSYTWDIKWEDKMGCD